MSLLLFISPFVWANSALVLEDVDQLYDINSAPSAQGFFAISDNTSIDSVFQRAQARQLSQFTMRPDFSLNKRFGVFISLENKTDVDAWFVHISHYLMDQVDVYVKTSNGVEHAIISSSRSSSSAYSTNMLGRAVPISLSKNEPADLLVVISSYHMEFPLHIGLITDNAYQTWKQNLDFIFIIAVGMVLGFILMSVTCFVILRDQVFAWFAISTSLFLFLAILRSPFGIDMLKWSSGLPLWISMVISLMQLSILMFVKSFLDLQANTLSYKLFNWVAGLVCLSLVVSLFNNNWFNVGMHSLLSLLVLVLIMVVGTVHATKHGILSVVFMLGWLPLLYHVVDMIYGQKISFQLNESTLSYANLKGIYLQALHFGIHFVVIVFRILQVKRDRIAAEIKSDAKTTFLAQLSHDLRQPLDTMGLFLDHLKDKTHNDENTTLLIKTKQIHHSMRNILSGLLDLSQLEAGKMPVTIGSVNIQPLFEELKHEYEQNTSVKGLEYRSRPCEVVIKTDKVLLKRLLGNLLSNATKYTAAGGVLMSARCRNDHVLLQVWDTGKGIDLDEQQLIFDLYQRSQTNDLATQSTGVGLATVQHIAVLLGFKVALCSTLDKGSVFSVCIPYSEQRREVV